MWRGMVYIMIYVFTLPSVKYPLSISVCVKSAPPQFESMGFGLCPVDCVI